MGIKACSELPFLFIVESTDEKETCEMAGDILSFDFNSISISIRNSKSKIKKYNER